MVGMKVKVTFLCSGSEHLKLRCCVLQIVIYPLDYKRKGFIVDDVSSWIVDNNILNVLVSWVSLYS